MKLTIDVINAFTETQFGGNPAAVVITDDWLADPLMQRIAAQNNLSETAFVVPLDQPEAGLPSTTQYAIRWFSPITEIDFCGHATLAAAFVLFNRRPPANALDSHSAVCPSTLTMHARAVGSLHLQYSGDGTIEMDFPRRDPVVPERVPAALMRGLSLPPQTVLQNAQAYIAVYSSAQEILEVTQDINQIKQLAPYDVVITAPGDTTDFVSRYFWPANGTEEDPVTGSIHTGLAPYWAQRLGQSELTAYQASLRGGMLYCRVTETRVYISGKAVQYLHGQIII
ncbi:PhzF family phenazine biosynthesis protein [Salinimonas sediminis]|uniref:PhzF family phenazine biosynthesis protein n=1 Tax=Salinimonas sediminis TaxID=2303538 RepID=A0A346NID0_9ALTE|nr:PhzF family phenazine biosynthesis protein [Salinimonas sediminis]AXR05287.1 PhzF family phenazine biosynthesis protein [Salinimonas sediminis]